MSNEPGTAKCIEISTFSSAAGNCAFHPVKPANRNVYSPQTYPPAL